jgi:multiple sugar transport system substrate-binding protein
MFTGSRHKEAVWKLIEFLSEQEQHLDFYRITGDLPARREAWEDTTLTANPYARAFYVQLNHVVATPKIPQWEQIAMKVQDYAEVASRGTLSVPDALKALDRDVDRILEKRRWVLHVGE